MLRDETSTRSQIRTAKVGYEWEEIGAGVQRLVLLVPTYGVELLRAPANHNFGLPGARCRRSPSDADEQDDDAADVLPGRIL